MEVAVTLMQPLDIEDVPPMVRGTSNGSGRSRTAITKMEELGLTETIKEAYRTQTALEVGHAFPQVFGEMNDQQTVNSISDIRVHFQWPVKHTGGNGKRKMRTKQRDTYRVTPQKVDAAFGKLPAGDADKAMKALAAALLPYIIPAVLDDLSTSIGLIKRARS